MTFRTDRFIATALGVGAALCLVAQTPLQPQWQHTWPFGMDENSLMSYAPAWKDNRVVVDPVTGLVHATVSDEDMLYSPGAELLYTFTPEGTDLTPSTIPVIGNVPFPDLYDAPYNTIALTDLSVHAGKISAGHTYRLIGVGNFFDWGHFFSAGPIAAERWRTSLGSGSSTIAALRSAAGPNGLILGNEGQRQIYGFDHGGLFRWRSQLPAPPRQLVNSNDIAFALAGDLVHRIAMSDGTLLSPSTPVPPFTERIVVRGDLIHHVRMTDNANVVVGKIDLSGQSSWEYSFALGPVPVITGLVVDDLDRVWVSCSLDDFMVGTMAGGYLLGVDASGSPLGTYTFGAALHSLATDGSNLFMTGWSANTGTETFLIGVDIALMTQLNNVVATDRIALQAWPNPASHSIRSELPENVRSLELLDTQGRVVRTWPMSTGQHTQEMDISDLAAGRYTLRANTTTEVYRTAVVIMR